MLTKTRSAAMRPWLEHYPQGIPHELHVRETPAWQLLVDTAARHPETIACCYYNQRLTWNEVADRSRRTASALRELGVQSGDRIGILMPNIPECLIALNGIWMAGGVAVALSPLSVPSEISRLLERTQCRYIIALDVLAPLVLDGDYRPEHMLMCSLRNRLPRWQQLGYAFAKLRKLGWSTPTDGPTRHSFDEMLARGDHEFEPDSDQSPNGPAYILATGGTTGSPKAVTLSHNNLVANARQIYLWCGAEEGESILALLPFFHSYGLSTCLLGGTALAATLLMHHRFNPRIAVRLIEQHSPRSFPAVPLMLSQVNALLTKRNKTLTAPEFCISGGAPLDPATAAEFTRRTGSVVVEGFGLSEASPVTHAGPLDGTNRVGTIGLPIPGTDAKIVDPVNGERELPVGSVGELVVRGPQVMLGYWNNPDATDAAIRDGWLYTGDLALRDADGFFRIVDRKKDLIITSGYNVYPNEVEEVLRGCDGVTDVAIVGVPDHERGEVVKAIVAVRDAETFDEHGFQRFAMQNLARHKQPRIVEVIEGDLPRNFLGKVLRRQLRTYDEFSVTASSPASDSVR